MKWNDLSCCKARKHSAPTIATAVLQFKQEVPLQCVKIIGGVCSLPSGCSLCTAIFAIGAQPTSAKPYCSGLRPPFRWSWLNLSFALHVFSTDQGISNTIHKCAEAPPYSWTVVPSKAMSWMLRRCNRNQAHSGNEGGVGVACVPFMT